MKRLSILLAFGLLTACGRTESNRQHSDAMEKFAGTDSKNPGAWVLQEQAAAGVVYEDSAVQPDDEEGKPVSQATLENYALEKQEAAASRAQGITGSALPGGIRSAAKVIVTQTQTSKSRKLARDASLAWAALGDLNTSLIQTASSLALSGNLAQQYGKLTYQEQLAQTQKSLDEQKQQQDQLAASVTGLEEQIKGIEGELKTLSDSSQSKAAEASDLERKAFVAKGKAQYDLYVLSAQKTNEADDLTAQADGTRLQLDLAQSKLKIERARLESAQGRVDSIGKALAALQTRSADTKKLADEAAARADSLTEERFKPDFEQLTGSYAEQVVKNFDAAVESLDAAIGSAEEAASSDSRDETKLLVAALGVEKLSVLRQRALAEGGYHGLLTTLKESITAARPQLADAIGQAVAASDERLVALQKLAEESGAKLIESLTPMAEGNGENTRLPLRYMLGAQRAMGAITGKDEFKTQADQTTQRIDQIGKSTEQPSQ